MHIRTQLVLKHLLPLSFLFLFLVNCNPDKQEKESLTVEDYKKAAKHFEAGMGDYMYNTISAEKWLDDDFLVYTKKRKEGREFVMVDTKKKEKKPAFDHDKLALSLSKLLNKEFKGTTLPFTNFEYINRTEAIEFYVEKTKYNCNLADYKCKGISETGMNEYISPNGKLAAYLDNYNLWVRNLETNKKTQLTFDGAKDYGYATDNAGWIKSKGPILKWSPNSDKIATFQHDSRGVGEMYLISTNVGHPKLEAWKYPLPGDSTVFKIERIVIHLEPKPKVVRFKMDPDFHRSTIIDHISDSNGELLDVEWKKDGSELAFVSSSRDHKIAHLQIVDTYTGNVTSILKEEVATYFESGVNMVNWHVLHDSNEVLWFSERDNWGHLYLYDLDTKQLKHQITKGEWAVQQVLYIDSDSRELFFIGAGKEPGNPYHKYLYKIDLDGNNLVCLTPDKGTHSITASPSWKYFVDTYSTTTEAPISVLRNRKGEKILDLETSDVSELKPNGWQEPIEFTVKARDGKTDLYGIMYLPSHYDKNKSYPVLNYIYPGPQEGSTGGYSFSIARSDRQAVAELGFVVVGVDAMGTPERSKSFHDAYYGNLGDNGIPDNITMIRQLAERYKGMDTTRIGIWGHSGGGFASTDAILRYPDFYDVAVSGSGNHDNRNYGADWGEKWHALLKKNTDGSTNYDSQANQLLAKNLKGKLLLAHGTMDDNVSPSNTLLVVDALIKANKDFDLILFPNKRHVYGDMTDYMTRRRWDYFVKHLKNMEPPKEFSFDGN